MAGEDGGQTKSESKINKKNLIKISTFDMLLNLPLTHHSLAVQYAVYPMTKN